MRIFNRFNLLKWFLGIFFATDDIPYAASEFVDKVKESPRKILLIGLLTFFWVSLAFLFGATLMFIINNDTLFNVTATTEEIVIKPYAGNEYPLWELHDAEVFDNCDDVAISYSGYLQINNASQISLNRSGEQEIYVSLSNESKQSSAVLTTLENENIKLNYCAYLKVKASAIQPITWPIDGKVTLGGEVKEGLSPMPLLLEGSISIADKATMSQKYYIAEPVELNIGDQFYIQNPTTQASGFVYIDANPGMKVTYSGKGEFGVIQRYKSEAILLENGIWTKLFNDETLIVLWLLLVAMYTAIKVTIRLNLE